ncbi:hypothetical protein KGM_210198 [Danaus plexippus plexippus]|uniref:Uncharacterized protein n=1 Tax=Danaus plexippus plexippus TaxID=278856 RepID=A0A212EN74_DANPL|nr:hypothetical protein KGM_210198 [Danaus plexippus plexippus]
MYEQLVWSTICSEVNARCGGERPRTPAQVKMWYENYKKKCKMRAHDTQVLLQYMYVCLFACINLSVTIVYNDSLLIEQSFYI